EWQREARHVKGAGFRDKLKFLPNLTATMAMTLKRIGLMSPGDMGQAVAIRLKELGFEVSTALEGRSPRTRKLAAEAGLTDRGDLKTLLESSDLVLSIVDPGSAMTLAQ